MSKAFHADDEVQQRKYDSGLMRRLLAYVRPFKVKIVLAIALLLVASLLGNVTPFLTMYAIDSYVNNPARVALEQGGAAGAEVAALREKDLDGLAALMLVFALLAAGETFARCGNLLIVAYVGQKTMLRMRLDLFEHLQRMSLRFLDKNPVGRLMTRLTNDVENVQQTIVSGVVEVANDLFTIIVILAFMLWVSPVLALITMSTVPLVFLSSFIFRKYARRTFLEIRKRVAALNAFMQETVTGIRVIQAFGQEERHFENYRQRNEGHYRQWLKQRDYHASYNSVINFLGSLSSALIVFYVGYRILGRDFVETTGASIGTLFAYVQWGERLFNPIRALAERYTLLLEAMASSERIFNLLDTPEDIPNRPGAITCQAIEGRVVFHDVWFAYNDEDWVAKNLRFSIRPGERIAVVGHTGAGKTTLINLLSRFYDVRRGAVLVDGVDVRDYEKVSLRRNIGVVLQDVFLFSGSIRDNLRLGNEDMSDAHLQACARHVNAAKFIDRLEKGYDHEVGERGQNLSTGQRQLIAFARALAHNPSILVLDEATSSVDTETEMLIQDAIAKLMEGRTSIVIAHRLSTIQHADRIIVMHHGEIRETGRHDELIAQRGLYYRLYQLQYRDQITPSG
jgi:ATP-binding cassette, subfamily B, multidrug efflux pump